MLLGPFGPRFSLNLVNESNRVKSHRLPNQGCDVRYDIEHVAYSCHEAGFLHELPLEALPRSLTEQQATTWKPPCARDARGRRGVNEEDFIAASRHAIGGDTLSIDW